MWCTDIHEGKIHIHMKCLKMTRNWSSSNWAALASARRSISPALVTDVWTNGCAFYHAVWKLCVTLRWWLDATQVSNSCLRGVKSLCNYQHRRWEQCVVTNPFGTCSHEWVLSGIDLAENSFPCFDSSFSFQTRWLSQRWLILGQEFLSAIDPSLHIHHES